MDTESRAPSDVHLVPFGSVTPPVPSGATSAPFGSWKPPDPSPALVVPSGRTYPPAPLEVMRFAFEGAGAITGVGGTGVAHVRRRQGLSPPLTSRRDPRRERQGHQQDRRQAHQVLQWVTKGQA